MGFRRPFLVFPNTRITRAIFVLSWISFVVGIGMNAFVLLEVFVSQGFPPNSKVLKGLYCLAIAEHFFGMWLPFAILLIHWEKRDIITTAIYLGGCAFTIFVSIVGIFIIEVYKKAGHLRKEYLADIGSFNLQNRIEHLTMSTDLLDCCGWYNPIDFGTTFPWTAKQRADKEYLRQLQVCYHSQKHKSLRHGCSHLFKEEGRRLCNTIAAAGIANIAMAGTFIVLYSIYIKKGPQKYQTLGEMQKNFNPSNEEDAGTALEEESVAPLAETTVTDTNVSLANETNTTQQQPPLPEPGAWVQQFGSRSSINTLDSTKYLKEVEVPAEKPDTKKNVRKHRKVRSIDAIV